MSLPGVCFSQLTIPDLADNSLNGLFEEVQIFVGYLPQKSVNLLELAIFDLLAFDLRQKGVDQREMKVKDELVLDRLVSDILAEYVMNLSLIHI